jgi:hypothetical protein
MGTQPAPLELSAAEVAVKEQLVSAQQHDPATMASLNDPFTFTEIADVLCSLPKGKAADLQGLTCELLRVPATVLDDGDRPDGQGTGQVEYACEPLVKCVAWIMQHVTDAELHTDDTLLHDFFYDCCMSAS